MLGVSSLILYCLKGFVLSPPVMVDVVWVSHLSRFAFQTAGREFGVDLLFSRYTKMSCDENKPLLQGMGASVPANVMACLLFLHRTLFHVRTDS